MKEDVECFVITTRGDGVLKIFISWTSSIPPAGGMPNNNNRSVVACYSSLMVMPIARKSASSMLATRCTTWRPAVGCTSPRRYW